MTFYYSSRSSIGVYNILNTYVVSYTIFLLLELCLNPLVHISLFLISDNFLIIPRTIVPAESLSSLSLRFKQLIEVLFDSSSMKGFMCLLMLHPVICTLRIREFRLRDEPSSFQVEPPSFWSIKCKV